MILKFASAYLLTDLFITGALKQLVSRGTIRSKQEAV